MRQIEVILDTSPIITFAVVTLAQPTPLETLLPKVKVHLVSSVAAEATANLKHPDAREVQRLLSTQYLRNISTPTTQYDRQTDS